MTHSSPHHTRCAYLLALTLLLSFGALGDLNAQPKSNKIKLPNITDAIFFKDMKAIKEYIKLRGNLDTPRDSLKRSPLIMAAAEGKLEIVKLLVKSGASVNQLVEESRYTPTALIGALSGSHVDVAQYLISAKADVNLAHGENTTLRSALNANKDKMLSLVRLLVRAKVDVNKTTKRFIPIFSAVRTMNPKIVDLILSRKPNLKVVNAYQQTLLLSALVAAKDAGDQADAMLKIIRALLKGGADPNQADDSGQTPLRWLMSQRHTKITQKLARSLVKRGANLSAQDSDGKTPLMVAISSTNTERSHALDKIKPLLKDKASLNVSTRRGGNALHLAVGKGYAEVVSGLLRAGITPNIKDWQGRTALWAAQEDLKMIKLLIKGGVDPNLPDNNGQSFFLGQIDVGNPEVALALLKLGANVNAAHAQNGETPLMLAAQLKDHKAALSLTRALLKRGAKVNAKSKYGQTALFEAARSENLKLISLLIKRGAKINHVSGDGETPLLYACRKRKFKSAALLVERGAQVNRVEKHRGLSALFYAVRGGDVKLVTLLLKRKASVNITDKEGNSPIFYASKVEIAQLLIANRADLTIKNKAGKTAAEHVSNPQVKALLSQTKP